MVVDGGGVPHLLSLGASPLTTRTSSQNSKSEHCKRTRRKSHCFLLSSFENVINITYTPVIKPPDSRKRRRRHPPQHLSRGEMAFPL